MTTNSAHAARAAARDCAPHRSMVVRPLAVELFALYQVVPLALGRRKDNLAI